MLCFGASVELVEFPSARSNATPFGVSVFEVVCCRKQRRENVARKYSQPLWRGMGGQCEAAFLERFDRRGATAPCRGHFRRICSAPSMSEPWAKQVQLLPGWKKGVKTRLTTFPSVLHPADFREPFRGYVLSPRLQVANGMSCVRRVRRGHVLVET